MIFGTATTAACLLTLFGLSTALPSPSNTFEKRAAVSGLAIFAYGSDINGLPVFYSDGKAFIGNSAPAGSSESFNVTFSTADRSSPSEKCGSFEQAGFVSTNGTLPTGGVTEGFVLFGKQVAYEASTTNLEMQFWAAPTNQTDLWALYWNSDVTADDDAFPAVLKITAPIVAKAKEKF